MEGYYIQASRLKPWIQSYWGYQYMILGIIGNMEYRDCNRKQIDIITKLYLIGIRPHFWVRSSRFLKSRFTENPRDFKMSGSWIFMMNLYLIYLSTITEIWGKSIAILSTKLDLISLSSLQSSKKLASSSVYSGHFLQTLCSFGVFGLVCLPLWIWSWWSDKRSFARAFRCFYILSWIR